MQLHTRKSAGFTLIELIVTMTILVIVLTIAAPSFRSLILSQRIKTTSYELFSALNYARSEAVKRNDNVTVRAGATSDGAWGTGWRVEDSSNNVLRTWSALSNLTLTENGSNATTLTYGINGRLTSTAPKFQISSSSTVTGVTSRCIQVDLSGRPSTQIGDCP